MHSRMSDGTHLTTWVSQQTKQRFAALARQRDVSESALLKHLVELTLQTSTEGQAAPMDAARRATRLSIRLRPDDHLLLRERARARGMAGAANQGERVSGPALDDLRALLRVCEGLRDHIKALLAANIRSWAHGYGERL